MPEVAELTDEAIDKIVADMEAALHKMDLLQSTMVKLRNAEVELLQTFEAAREFMHSILHESSKDREILVRIFGGDCERIARIKTVVEIVKFSEMQKADQRHADCASACESVEQVLQDLGLGWKLRQAEEKAKIQVTKRRSTTAAEVQAAAQAASTAEVATASAATVEEPAVVEPPPPEPDPPKEKKEKPTKKDVQSEALCATIDEDLATRILACEDCAALEVIGEVKKGDSLGNWMIWMVHRAYLDDPTLDKFDFTNLKMPPGTEEPRISPKLAKAMAWNSHITHLMLPNTGLLGPEGAVLAESLTKNTVLRVMNLDSNFLAIEQLESLANAAGKNQTLEEIRINNQHGVQPGRSMLEALLNMTKANQMIVKLGFTLNDAFYRDQIDRQIMRNIDAARARRVAARKAAEAEAAAS